jgi:hypothetical protein
MNQGAELLGENLPCSRVWLQENSSAGETWMAAASDTKAEGQLALPFRLPNLD